MIKLSQVTAAPDKINGVWVPFADGTEFFIASTTRPEFQSALTKARKGFSKFQLDKEETGGKIYAAALTEACLLDWKGLAEEDGTTEIQCTPANKKRIMEIPVLREFISAAANELATFQAEATAGDADALKSGAGMGNGVGTAPEGTGDNR